MSYFWVPFPFLSSTRGEAHSRYNLGLVDFVVPTLARALGLINTQQLTEARKGRDRKHRAQLRALHRERWCCRRTESTGHQAPCGAALPKPANGRQTKTTGMAYEKPRMSSRGCGGGEGTKRAAVASFTHWKGFQVPGLN